MNPCRAPFPVLVALSLALVALAGACGGSDGQALQTYFQETSRISGQYGGAADAARALYETIYGASSTDEQKAKAFLFYMEATARNTRDEVAAREKVKAPPEVEAAHLDLLTAARLVAKTYEDALQSAASATTATQLRAALDQADYDARLKSAQDRARQDCAQLEQIANQHKIEADVCRIEAAAPPASP